MRLSPRVRHRRGPVLTTVIASLCLAVAGCTPGGAAGQESPSASSTAGAPATGTYSAAQHPPAVVAGHPLRAFTPDAWWNTPVPADAPSNPQADGILQYMQTGAQAGNGCLHLSGAGDNSWGTPVYWSRPGDPQYDVAVPTARRPPELNSLRIPVGALPGRNSDAEMTIFDVDRGYTVALTGARFDARTGRWSATGATVTYLDSNGLDERTGQSTDARNIGSHRGNNPADMMVRYDEVAAGAVDHVLKVASGPETSARHVFPMVGSDGASTDPLAPPEGLRFRIKPSVDLDRLNLQPAALVIARALQTYGFYIGDSSGRTALKLEDTRTEGRGQLWSVAPTALCGLPLSPQFWDVLPEGYQPPPAA